MLKLNYATDPNSTDVQDLHRDQVKLIEEKKLAEAFRYRYHLNDVQHGILQTYFEHQYVLTEIDPAIRLKTSMHPVMAILNDYSIVHANKIAATATGNHVRVITVGDSSTRRVSNTLHNCLLLDNPREAYRIISSNTVKNSNRNMCDAARTGHDNRLDCLKGTQNCDFKADIMLYMHSLYDITPTDFAQAMLKHKAKQAYAYMHLPIFLCGDEYSEIEENVLRVKRSHKHGKPYLCMSMGDNSIPYLHCEENWKAWNTVTTITYGGFKIVREDVAVHGPLHIINFCVTKNLPCEIFKTHPLSKYGAEYYLVPSIKELLHNNFVGDFHKLKKYVVKRHIVDRLLNYAVRQSDEGYKFNEFATVFSGLLNNIRFGAKELLEATVMGPRKTHDVTLSLFIIGALRRTDRTKVISECFSHIKKWYSSTWTLDLRHWFTKHENEITMAYDGDYEKASSNTTRIKWFNVFEFEDEHIQHNIDVKVNFPELITEVEDTEYEFGEEPDKHKREFTYWIANTDGKASAQKDTTPIMPASIKSLAEPTHVVKKPIVNNKNFTIEGDEFDQIIVNNELKMTHYEANPMLIDIDVPYVGNQAATHALNQKHIAKIKEIKDQQAMLKNFPDGMIEMDDISSNTATSTVPELTEILTDRGNETGNDADSVSDFSMNSDDVLLEYNIRNELLVEAAETARRTEVIEQSDAVESKSLDEARFHSQLLKENLTAKSNQTLEERLDNSFKYKDFTHEENMLSWHQSESSVFLIHQIERSINNEFDSKKLNDLHYLRNIKLQRLDPSIRNVYIPILEVDPTAYMVKFNQIVHKNISSAMKLDIEEIVKNKTEIFNVPIIPKNVFRILFDNWLSLKNNSGKSPLMTSDLFNRCVEVRQHYKTRPLEERLHYSHMPSVFGAGHCAMNAIWQCLPKHDKPSVGKFLRRIYYYAALCKIEGIDEYIVNGWKTENSMITNQVIQHAFSIIAQSYNIRIRIYDEFTSNLIIISSPDSIQPENLTIYYKNSHYTATPTGGSSTTLEMIVEKSDILKNRKDMKIDRFVTIQPQGYEAKLMTKHYKTDECDEIKHYKSVPKDLKFNDNVKMHHAWCDEHALKNVFTTKYDCVYWEIDYTFKHTASILKYIQFMQNANTINIIVSKRNHPEMWRLSSLFEKSEIHDIGDKVAHVFTCFKNKINYDILNKCYDLYHQDETDHEIPFNLKKTIAFAKDHFKDICPEQLPRVLKALKDCNGDHKYAVRAITGYASAGKTTSAMEKYKRDSIWIAPSRTLSYKHNGDGAQSYTQHTVFAHLKDQYQTIVIDEISQFTLEFVSIIYALNPNAVIVLVGDINQCDGVTKGTPLDEVGITTNMLRVHAVPWKICQAMNDRFGFMMLGDPKNDAPIYVLDKAVKLAELVKTGVQMLSYNDSTNKKLAQMGATSSSIATFQGSRKETICFYIDDKSVTTQLTNRSKFVYTAMTRATKNLVLYGNSSVIEHFLTINGSPLRNLEEFNNVYHANDVYVDAVEDGGLASAITCQQEAFNGIEKIFVSETPVVDTLIHAIKTVNDSAPFQSISSTTTAPIQQGVMTAPVEALIPDYRTFKSYKYLPNIKLLRDYVNTPEDCKNAFAHRYALKVKFQKEREVNFNAQSIIRGICKAVFGNERSIDKLKAGLRTTPEELRRHAEEYLVSAQKKLGKNHSFVKDLESDFNCWEEIISLVTKKQSKFDPEEGFDASDKAGQGVASLSKRINFLFSAYARAMLWKIREMAHKNGRKIIIATHDSDEAIANEFYGMNYGTPGKWACFDVSQWDSRFTKFMAKVTHTFLEWMGCPQWLNDWWYTFRQQWRIVCHTKYGNMTLRGYEKQFSGNPFTICENTLCNMGLINIVFDFKNVQLQMAKGDDTAIKCEDYVMTEEGKKMLANSGHSIKKHFDVVGDFAGYILTDDGMMPDLLRYATKFLARPYHDQAQFDESKANAKAQASLIKQQSTLMTGCEALAIFYSKLKITAAQFQTMYNFLMNVDQIKFESLTLVNQTRLQI